MKVIAKLHEVLLKLGLYFVYKALRFKTEFCGKN
jgi:hypothetical protein